MTAVILLVIINIAITSTHVWRKQYLEHLRYISNIFIYKNLHYLPRKKSIRIFVHNTDGVRLQFTAENERDIYFKNLKLAWA